MPELPEVETVTRGLKRLIIGKKIVSEVHDWPKSFPNDPGAVEQFMLGAKIIGIRRRGKAMIIDLSTKYSIVVHLKMTGQVVYMGEQYFGAGHPNDSLLGNLPDKSTRIEITFSDKSKLFFNDQRKFGWMKLIPTLEVDDMTFFKTLGPEPLAESFTASQFIARIARRKNTSIKAAILDQTVLAGVGNIYADEALFAAKIHPARRVGELTKKQLSRLLVEIKAVMMLSIEKGGSTDKNYVDAEGKRGSYLGFAKVFRREGQQCLEDGSTILKSRVATRGTHYCPTCQKPPRGFK
jgi:formamidopyrimidine-DNA glycosylase